eukprot:13091902-Ditylum_brightwellii.AAC.1
MPKFYNLNTRFIDYVLTYPHVEIKSVIYLHPSARVIMNTNGQDLVLKLKKNLYGLKATPYCSGYPINNIPLDEESPKDRI